MKVYFCNDTSAYHAGSAAVCAFIREQLEAGGHSIVPENRAAAPDTNPFGDCDAVLVNGEGTMHHDSNRAQQLIDTLRKAQEQDRRTFLVNSVWDSMTLDCSDVLKNLEQFIVRENHSRDAAVRSQNVEPQVSLDFSFWAHGDAQPVVEHRSEAAVVSDFYSNEFKCFVRPTGGWLSKMPFVDIKNSSWDGLIGALRRSQSFVTGRHHGVYASCVARTPFAVLAGNTHKIEGLIATSGTDIPVAKSPAELRKQAESIASRATAYEELFEWMSAQPRWTGI